MRSCRAMSRAADAGHATPRRSDLTMSCELLAEMVGRVQLVNCGVGLNEKSAELRSLAAHRTVKARKITRRRWLVAPAIGDSRSHVFPYRRSDRLSVWSVFPQMDVEIREVACERTQAGVERVERALHLREHKAQHQSREGDEDRDDQSHVVLRLACSMSLSQLVMQIHSDAGCAEQKSENDRDEQAAVRHSRVSVLPAPIRCAADHASRALNALLGLAVAAVQTPRTDRRGGVWASAAFWVAASGLEPVGPSPAVNAVVAAMVSPSVPAPSVPAPAVIVAAAVIVGAAAMVVAAVVAAAVKSGSDDGPAAPSISIRHAPAVDVAMESESASPRGQRYR